MEEQQKIIENLETQIRTLKKENTELKETVQWMHDLIWDLIKKIRS